VLGGFDIHVDGNACLLLSECQLRAKLTQRHFGAHLGFAASNANCSNARMGIVSQQANESSHGVIGNMSPERFDNEHDAR
jgi:hypothetical protein